jgi:uncharacterized membrane protein YagU involved in acid resistance
MKNYLIGFAFIFSAIICNIAKMYFDLSLWINPLLAILVTGGIMTLSISFICSKRKSEVLSN